MATASKAALRAGYQHCGNATRTTAQVDTTFQDACGVEKLSLWALKVGSPLLPGPVPRHQLYLRYPRCSQR